MIGQPAGLLIPAERVDDEPGALARIARGERIEHYETERVRKDGTRVQISLTVSPILDAARHISGASKIARDTSEQNQIKAALHETEARFRATFEQAAVGMAHVRLDGRWLRVNMALCTMVGYAPEELSTKTFHDLTHPDDHEADAAYEARLLGREASTYSTEKRYLYRQGRVVWVNAAVTLVRNPLTAQPQYFISVVRDIMARKEAE